MAQGKLFGPDPKPIDFPEVEFLVSWRCDDPTCRTHSMGLHSWDIHELARGLRSDPDRLKKIEQKMKQMVDLMRFDLFLFLGDYCYRPKQFGLMSAIPIMKPKPKAAALFAL